MSLVLIGTNQKYSSLEIREKFSLSSKDELNLLSLLIDKRIVDGAVVLSTCERIEIYAQTDNIPELKDYFLRGKEIKDLDRYIYIKEGPDAVSHLFRVAAGLDSQIIGENEILHQLKNAYQAAMQVETSIALLNRVFQRALFVGKHIREKTNISKTDPSIAASAVDLAEKLSGGFKDKRIYIIGAGTVARRLIKSCVDRGARCAVVANRTYDKAIGIACELKVKAIRFDQFYHSLDDADILFSATSSRHLILKKDIFVEKRKSGRKLLLFDLAFPRDIDPDIRGIENISLFDLDDFNDVNWLRTKEIREAEEAVKEKLIRFVEKEEKLWKSESVFGQACLR